MFSILGVTRPLASIKSVNSHQIPMPYALGDPPDQSMFPRAHRTWRRHKSPCSSSAQAVISHMGSEVVLTGCVD